MGQAFSYPSGPEATAKSCLNGGQCPSITSAANPGLIALYAIWGSIFALCISFFFVRLLRSKKHKERELHIENKVENDILESANGMKSDSEIKTKEMGTESFGTGSDEKKNSNSGKIQSSCELDGSDDEISNSDLSTVNIKLKPYQSNIFGTMCFILFNLISLGFVILFIVIQFGKYFDCQLKGIDNLCFYGNYLVFGNYTNNSYYMFTVWALSGVWFFFCLVNLNRIRNWFRLPCSMGQADYMYVWVLDTFEVLDSNSNRLVNLVHKIQDYLTPPELLNGHDCTVKVSTNEDGVKFFIHEGTRYLYDPDSDLFVSPKFNIVGSNYAAILSCGSGLSSVQAENRYHEFGPNAIPFTPTPVYGLIQEEFSTFFYYYQFIMYSVWIWFSYLFIAMIELTVVILSALINVYIIYKNEHTIAQLTKHQSEVRVLRDGQLVTISSLKLVPGDVVAVDEKCGVPCDMVLISGNALCDESSLTGESKPIQKVSCPNDDSKSYDPKKAGVKHSLFAGTKVLQTENVNGSLTMALVTATGINTSKGELISQILFPEKTAFRYEEELKVVFVILGIYAICASCIAIAFMFNSGSNSDWVTMWAYVIFTISQVMSPLLPVALKVGQIRSCARLTEKDVFCVNPGRIAISGKIRVFCFDKTGTITKDGMDFGGVVPVNGSQFGPLIKNAQSEETPQIITNSLATCHALTKYGENEVVGNEVETKMFEAVGWTLGETDNQGVSHVTSPTGEALEILKKFEFDHELQTMSVIVKDTEKNNNVFVKGSFEKVKALCKPESIPVDYDDVAKQYALDGAYVLALAHRGCMDHYGDLKRSEVEEQGAFEMLGLMILRNEPKEDSKAAIEELRAGAVRPVMITGDNAQCGQYISHSCSLVNQGAEILLAEFDKKTKTVHWSYMAITENKTYYTTEQVIDMVKEDNEMELGLTGNDTLHEIINSNHMPHLLLNMRIFARMSPESKVLGIHLFRKLGLIVGMCGDGGNDCGALRAAQAGLALSDAEASIVSPFTSKSKSIRSVVDLLKEGRASLHTSFSVYKFLIYYGQIFTIVKLISFYYGVIMCQMNYLFIDAVAVISLGYTMTLSGTSSSLKTKRPTSSLLGKINLASSVGTYLLTFLGLITCLIITVTHKDYVPWPANLAQGQNWWVLGDNWECTVLFISMYLNLVSQAGIYSFGYKFRESVYKNWPLVINVIALLILTSLVILLPSNDFTNLWHIASFPFNGPNASGVWRAYQDAGGSPSPPMSFELRITIWIVSFVFIALSAGWQFAVVEGPVGGYFRKRYPSNRLIIRT